MNLLYSDITWPQLKALHQVYKTGSTRSNLFANAYFERLRKEKRLLRYKGGNHNIIEGSNFFKGFYEEHFLKAYHRYEDFFTQSGVISDGRRPYRLYDLETLIYIQKNRAELGANLTTERTFANQLFNSSKYLENNISIRNAVLKILNITIFPNSDPKNYLWRLTVDCPNPKMVLLCENLDTLKIPDTAIALHTELWYVGGNNTGILKNLSQDKLQLPIYYRCDWDYDGLRIFSTITQILTEKNKTITLLEPTDTARRLPVNSPYHHSKWKAEKPFSGLDENAFTGNQRTLIHELIKVDQWIEEESQDLETVLKHNNCI